VDVFFPAQSFLGNWMTAKIWHQTHLFKIDDANRIDEWKKQEKHEWLYKKYENGPEERRLSRVRGRISSVSNFQLIHPTSYSTVNWTKPPTFG
jgi:hypothetical protein